MLTSYLQAAMSQAQYELLEDGSYYGEISDCPGVWANEVNLESCKSELNSVLEDWVLGRVAERFPLPTISGLELKVSLAQ